MERRHRALHSLLQFEAFYQDVIRRGAGLSAHPTITMRNACPTQPQSKIAFACRHQPAKLNGNMKQGFNE
jgi:hypothetical protein